MKAKFLIILFVVLGSFMNAQSYKKMRITRESGQKMILKNATIDELTNSITYTDKLGERRKLSLNGIETMEEKKGSQWLPYMIGGLVGSTAITLALPKDAGHIGTRILGSTLITTLIGVMIPKYKLISVGEKSTSKLTYNGTGFTYEF